MPAFGRRVFKYCMPWATWGLRVRLGLRAKLRTLGLGSGINVQGLRAIVLHRAETKVGISELRIRVSYRVGFRVVGVKVQGFGVRPQ